MTREGEEGKSGGLNVLVRVRGSRVTFKTT
jgi:hypothetical protein